MRRGRASNTAQFVAFNRALGDLAPQVVGFSDPTAERFLPDRWIRRVERARAHLPRPPLPFWMRGMGVFNQFRTAVLDRALRASLPLRQVVILGAGLDGRAYRVEELGETVVFEVDHPDTQARKKSKAGAMASTAKEVRFVAVDFTCDELGARLQSAGLDPAARTFWLWEGVTMYLAPSDVRRTLADIGRLSGAGSRLALTYLARSAPTLRKRIVLFAFGLMTGEPMRSVFAPAELDRLAAGEGWATLSDTGIDDWKHELAPNVALTERQVGLQWNERVWVGERR